MACLSPNCFPLYDGLMLTFPLCRYLPAIGRFLIVVTFLEDALRIITQWSDQLLYLHDYRHSMIPLYYYYTKLISISYSSMGPYPPLLDRQRPRHDFLLDSGYCPKIL